MYKVLIHILYNCRFFNYSNYFRWRIEYGSTMERLGGDEMGQTQVAHGQFHVDEPVTFNHPLDLHFAEVGLQGWGAPRICIQCFKFDEFGRRMLVGYGFASLPTTSGFYNDMQVCAFYHISIYYS